MGEQADWTIDDIMESIGSPEEDWYFDEKTKKGKKMNVKDMIAECLIERTAKTAATQAAKKAIKAATMLNAEIEELKKKPARPKPFIEKSARVLRAERLIEAGNFGNNKEAVANIFSKFLGEEVFPDERFEEEEIYAHTLKSWNNDILLDESDVFPGTMFYTTGNEIYELNRDYGMEYDQDASYMYYYDPIIQESYLMDHLERVVTELGGDISLCTFRFATEPEIRAFVRKYKGLILDPKFSIFAWLFKQNA